MPFRKLKPHESETTEALIAAIERKDRRFRLFQTLFMVGTFLALIFIISAQQRTLQGVEEQLTQAKGIASETAKRSDDSDKTILRRLDCMSVFFSQRDRTNLSIENIDKCTLNRGGDLQEFFTQTPGEAPETTKEQQPDPNLAPSATPQAGVVPPQGSGEQAIEDKEEVEPRPPLTLDLPVLPPVPLCVPITGICLR